MERWELYQLVEGMTFSELTEIRSPEILAAIAKFEDDARDREFEVLQTVWVDGIAYPQY